MASADFSKWVALVNFFVYAHPLPHMVDLKGLALCHLACQNAIKTSRVHETGMSDCQHTRPSRISINGPRLLGNITVYTAELGSAYTQC
jgi:hypothetical protein